MCVQFVDLALGKEDSDGGIQLVYENTCCLAWGGIFIQGRIGVLSMSSLF